MHRFLFLLSILCMSTGLWAGHDDLISRLIDSKQTVDKQAEIVNVSLQTGRPLTGAELEAINESARERLILREEAYGYFSRQFYLVQKRVKKTTTVTDEELEALILSLSVAVTLFDTTLYTYYKFHDNPKMRRLLNEKDSAYRREGNTFEKSVEGIFSFKNSRYLQRAIKIYDRFYIDRKVMYEDPDLQRAHFIIQNSYLYNNFRERKIGGVAHDIGLIIASRIKISTKAKIDFLNYVGNSIIYYGSKLFGNIVGGFQKRRGILYKDADFLDNVESKWKPMDVLLEKTPFRLTDNFIPGFWGHAAIYIGTREDLEEMGIWNHELVQQYAKEISKGRYIVEALRDKVQMNTLEHFSDIDDFALLRLRAPLTKEKTAEHILRALSHVGKKYDFSFDVETGDTIVCSELHYRTYIDVKFNTTPYIGRSTISVDQVAEQAKLDMPFEPIILYINGREVKQDIQKTFDALLAPLPEYLMGPDDLDLDLLDAA